MTERIDLKKIEKKIWISFYQDGFWDLYWGLLLFGFGISPVLEDFGLIKPFNFLIFPVLAFSILFFGKKYISIPRMGQVNFNTKRKSDHKKLWILGIIFFIITTTLFIITKFTALGSMWKGSADRFYAPILYALFFIFTISIIAYFIEFKRLYLYALLFGLSIPLAETLFFIVGDPIDGLIAFSITSIPILITGIVLLIKFSKKYKIIPGGV